MTNLIFLIMLWVLRAFLFSTLVLVFLWLLTHRKMMSHIMRKPTFCICNNKGRLISCAVTYSSSTFSIHNFQPLAIFCAHTGWFVSDLFGSPYCWFSHVKAQICSTIITERQRYLFKSICDLFVVAELILFSCDVHNTRTI